MLRYNMSHKDAAELLSFPACVKWNKPVMAFTSTRWNSLQNNHYDWESNAPSTGECLSFALAGDVMSTTKSSSPVEIVLHSARDEKELKDALDGIRSLSADEIKMWRKYGDLDWNYDGFDEYPDERIH